MHACAECLLITCRSDEQARQLLLCKEGVIAPLVHWILSNEARAQEEMAVDPSLRQVAALALADVARGNPTVQTRVTDAAVLEPLFSMLDLKTLPENLTSACTLLATLAADHRANQLLSAQHGALPLLVALISSPPSSQPGTKERHT